MRRTVYAARYLFYGAHSVDIDGELAQLDTDGYRPLLLAAATAARR